MNRIGRPFVLFVLTITWIAGAALFPHALEPGRSERDGIVLNLLVDSGDGLKTNDWYRASNASRVDSTRTVLHLEATTAGLQLLSRPLPVFAAACYAIVVHGQVTSGTMRLAVADEDLRVLIGDLPVSAGARTETLTLAFSTSTAGRITVVIEAGEGAVIDLERIALERLKQPKCD